MRWLCTTHRWKVLVEAVLTSTGTLTDVRHAVGDADARLYIQTDEVLGVISLRQPSPKCECFLSASVPADRVSVATSFRPFLSQAPYLATFALLPIIQRCRITGS